MHIIFARSIREIKHDETIRRVKESCQLIYDTVNENADAVAAQIENYKYYYLALEELPPAMVMQTLYTFQKKDSPLPALVIELKWNKSAEGAIAQIKNNHYPDAIKGLGCDILLVGINYDKNAPAGKRKHTCVIGRLEIE